MLIANSSFLLPVIFSWYPPAKNQTNSQAVWSALWLLHDIEQKFKCPMTLTTEMVSSVTFEKNCKEMIGVQVHQPLNRLSHFFFLIRPCKWTFKVSRLPITQNSSASLKPWMKNALFNSLHWLLICFWDWFSYYLYTTTTITTAIMLKKNEIISTKNIL